MGKWGYKRGTYNGSGRKIRFKEDYPRDIKLPSSERDNERELILGERRILSAFPRRNIQIRPVLSQSAAFPLPRKNYFKKVSLVSRVYIYNTYYNQSYTYISYITSSEKFQISSIDPPTMVLEPENPSTRSFIRFFSFTRFHTPPRDDTHPL